MAVKYKLDLDRKEGNILMCQFLGGEVHISFKIKNNLVYSWTGDVVDSFRKLRNMPTGYNSMLLEHVKFHTSYDWLFPVVDKIESLGFNLLKGFDNSFHIVKAERHQNKTIVESTDSVTETIDRKFYGYTKIPDNRLDALWLVIVKFLKWYNENSNI